MGAQGSEAPSERVRGYVAPDMSPQAIRDRWNGFSPGTYPSPLRPVLEDVRALLAALDEAHEEIGALNDDLASRTRAGEEWRHRTIQADQQVDEWKQRCIQADQQRDALRDECASLEQELRMTQRLKEETERVARIANHERDVAVDAAAKIQKEKDAAVRALMARPPQILVTEKQMKKIKKKGLADDDPRDPNI